MVQVVDGIHHWYPYLILSPVNLCSKYIFLNCSWSLNEYNFYFYLLIAVRVKKMTFVCNLGNNFASGSSKSGVHPVWVCHTFAVVNTPEGENI